MWALLAAGCGLSEAPHVTVFWTLDTLSAPAAHALDRCAAVGAALGAAGRDLACLDGAIAPSSWTGESHARLLFPDLAGGDGTERAAPDCGDRSFLDEIAQQGRGVSVFGADNAVFTREDCDGSPAWATRADVVFTTQADPHGLPDLAAEDHPVRRAIDAVVAAAADGGTVAAFLNTMEVGGHTPRCWQAPDTPACSALWDRAVDFGLVAADGDRVGFWLDPALDRQFWSRLEQAEGEVPAEATWGAVQESVADHWDAGFGDALDALTAGLGEAGRLEDLRLVITSDHGEDPCVPDPTGFAPWSCGHGGMPSEWTAAVPVFVSPASLAEGWVARGEVGDVDLPWSTVRLGPLLVADAGGRAPAAWDPEPVGTATSWRCPAGTPAMAIRVDGDGATRCWDEACATTGWTDAPSPSALPESAPGATPTLDPDEASGLCGG